MSKHICLVPNEWGRSFTSGTIEVILKKKITCGQITQKVGGVGINLNGVKTRLDYWDEQPWMRNVGDKKTWPDPEKYFGVYMSCKNCGKSLCSDTNLISPEVSILRMTHKIPCWIPREWLDFPWDALQVIVSQEILKYYLKCGRIEGSVVRINGVTGRLQLHNDVFWMRDDFDVDTKPDLKAYFSFLIPCIFCNKLNKIKAAGI